MSNKETGNTQPVAFCKKCILRLHTVDHNSEGICAYCQNYDSNQPWDSGREEFIADISSFVGQGRQGFDILCPITGGKDSTFALHCLRTLVPEARILAFTWDHGFHHPQAWINIRNAVSASGVRHVTEYFGNNASDALKVSHAFHKVLGSTCAGCIMCQKLTCYLAALKYEVPAILWGTIQGQNSRMFTTGIAPETLGPKTIAERVDTLTCSTDKILPVLELVLQEAFSRMEYENAIGRIEEIINSSINSPSFQLPKSVMLGYYFDWNKNEAEVMSSLSRDFGFAKPEEITTHTSCLLSKIRGHHEYLYPKRAGFFTNRSLPGDMEFELAMVVRSGIISREQGFRELEAHNYSEDYPADTVDVYTDKVGITRSEFDKHAWKKSRPSLSFKARYIIKYLLRWTKRRAKNLSRSFRQPKH